MREIIIFVVLSSIMTIALALAFWELGIDEFEFVIDIPFIVFELVYIITITFLILLKNWARITYIIIHIILTLFILFIFKMHYVLFYMYAVGSDRFALPLLLIYVGHGFFIFPPLLIYFIISIICFLQSDTAKLFKQ